MFRRPSKTWVEISRQALLHNVRAIRKLLNRKTKLLAVVKANAYGHGAALVTPVFARGGVNWFGVDSIDEALEIEPMAAGKPILILGYTPANRLEEAVRHGFRQTVYTEETVRELEKISKRLGTSISLHVKCDTGASRQGILPREILPFVKLIGTFPHLSLEGLASHFSNSEDTANPAYSEEQLLAFRRVVSQLERHGIRIPIHHIASSAGTLLLPEAHENLVRSGVSLYGLWPSRGVRETLRRKRPTFSLRPALAWKTIVAQVKTVPRGTPIGYDLTERVARDSRIALLPIGYYDGYDRALSSVGAVLIHGRRAKILGRICMNMCMVDVTNVRNVRSGDEVVLIGRQGSEVVSADEVAEHAGTIHYEIVTHIHPLIPRVLI